MVIKMLSSTQTMRCEITSEENKPHSSQIIYAIFLSENFLLSYSRSTYFDRENTNLK